LQDTPAQLLPPLLLPLLPPLLLPLLPPLLLPLHWSGTPDGFDWQPFAHVVFGYQTVS
jgi:hypothetical protein